jgi:anti-sigma factor ChrR (cupin superfamily)
MKELDRADAAQSASAVTPNAANHAGLPPLASRFVDVASLPWEKTRFPGVEGKTLVIDRKTGMITALMKFAPGATLTDHEHVKIEQTFVLEGSLVCGEGECRKGDFVWRPAGSRHSARGGDQGGLMLAIFQIPNRFYEADGRETDQTGQDWNAAWSDALFGK